MSQHIQFNRAALALAASFLLVGCATGSAGTAVSPAAGTGQIDHSSDRASQRAVLIRADSAWTNGAYPLAAVLYQTAFERDSSNSLAVFRLATLRSWDNRLDVGIKLYRRYVALEPKDVEGRIALARALAWSGQYSSAIALYDSVLAGSPRYRDAILGRAQTLAWSGGLNEALSIYKQWVDANPTDREAALEYARALSWNGDLGEAERLYTQLARTGDANAQKGLARVIAWRGDLDRSERAWQQVLEIRPNDAEALTGLAQTLRWQGRQSDAESALELALRADPAYGDARALLRWVQADLRPSMTATGFGTNDSDNNRATNFIVDYLNPARWNTAFGGRYAQRRANFAAIDSHVDAVSVFARWQQGSWQVRADGGASRHSSTLGPSAAKPLTIGSGALHLGGRVGQALSIGLGASRAPFDETALLIANGVVSSEYSGEAELALPDRFSIAGAASQARLTGGSRDNTRNAYSSTLRWKYNRNWSLAVGGRQFGYDTTTTDGYFAPHRYTLLEGSTRGHLGGELGWNADADVGLGRQSIELFGSSAASRLAERGALSMGYRFDPTQELTLVGSYANVAAPGQTGGSEYKYYSFGIRVRMGF
jgi:tetratricopeptide (TPR) repeat protein